MNSEKEVTTNLVQSRVADFYAGKSIFLTGASGFVGTVLLECLLRCCPGIETIYILIRPRRGLDVEQRKQKILEKTIFETLRKSNPFQLDKIQVVEGDITRPKLGLSDSDYDMLVQKVSIVFHCAASIALIKPLEVIVRLNVLSVNSVIELCKEMKKLEVLVYTSTAFSNGNRGTIEETIYRLPFPAQRFIDALNVGKEELQALVDECYPRWPNTYTFSKCLAENLLADKASDIPFAIVRPSVIACVHKSPLPGYVEDSSGITTLSLAIAKGFAKVVWVHLDTDMNVVSADATANAHVISAWSVGTGRHESPFIVNAAQSKNIGKMRDVIRELKKFIREVTVPNSFSRPTQFLIVTESFLWYRIASLFQHYVQAYVVDFIFKLRGRKPKMLSMYQFYDNVLLSTYDIGGRSFRFICENFENTSRILHPEDAEIFSTDLTGYNAKNCLELAKTGAPFLDFKMDKRPVEERKKIMNQRFWTFRLIKMTALLVLFAILYLAFIIAQRLAQTFSNSAEL